MPNMYAQSFSVSEVSDDLWLEWKKETREFNQNRKTLAETETT